MNIFTLNKKARACAQRKCVDTFGKYLAEVFSMGPLLPRTPEHIINRHISHQAQRCFLQHSLRKSMDKTTKMKTQKQTFIFLTPWRVTILLLRYASSKTINLCPHVMSGAVFLHTDSMYRRTHETQPGVDRIKDACVFTMFILCVHKHVCP